jgi:hypothetical protein
MKGNPVEKNSDLQTEIVKRQWKEFYQKFKLRTMQMLDEAMKNQILTAAQIKKEHLK